MNGNIKPIQMMLFGFGFLMIGLTFVIGLMKFSVRENEQLFVKQFDSIVTGDNEISTKGSIYHSDSDYMLIN